MHPICCRSGEPRLTDGIDIHWRTNYLGTMQLAHAALSLLLQSAADTRDARIVKVVSMLHARGRVGHKKAARGMSG